MPLQTSVTFQNQAAIQGMLWGMAPNYEITAICDTAIGFGIGVANASGTSATLTGARRKIALPAASTAVLAGVTVLDHLQAQGTEATISTVTDTQTSNYSVGYPIRVLRRGLIWVLCETNVAPGDPVHWRYDPSSGGTAGTVGNFRNATIASVTIDVSASCRWATVGSAGGLAVLELNLP